jgi:hypothetical protein
MGVPCFIGYLDMKINMIVVSSFLFKVSEKYTLLYQSLKFCNNFDFLTSFVTNHVRTI